MGSQIPPFLRLTFDAGLLLGCIEQAKKEFSSAMETPTTVHAVARYAHLFPVTGGEPLCCSQDNNTVEGISPSELQVCS